MDKKSCCSCWKEPLTKYEIGISKKLLGMKTKKYYCMNCMAGYLDTTVNNLLEQIEEFKADGCTLF